MKNLCSTLVLVHLFFMGITQEMAYVIMDDYTRGIEKNKISGLVTISDINPGYPASWVDEYISVEITTIDDGKSIQSQSANDTLSFEQKKNLQNAEIGTDVMVRVNYMPKNFLKDNESKYIKFTYTIIPETKAEFPGGFDTLQAYLKENTVAQIPEELSNTLSEAIVSFSISREGKIEDVEISKSANNARIDQIILDAIANMPQWIPAENDGQKIKQAFKFSIGNMIGC